MYSIIRNDAPCAQTALLAGKHVIVEKPLVPTSSEATELIDIASANKLVLATYQNRRWDSDFLTVRRLLDVERVFGALRAFLWTAISSDSYPSWTGDISEFHTSYDRFRLVPKGGWKDEAQWGNGVVFDVGSHLVSPQYSP